MPEITSASVGYTHVEEVYLGTSLILDDWTPRSLFAVAGTLGGWYDFSDRSTLYQNATCTTPITAGGQKVAGVKCKLGIGVNIVNTVVANQPTYSAGGKGSIAFGGTTFLYGFDNNLPNYANFTLGYSSQSNLAASKTNTSNIYATGDENGWATGLSVNAVNGFNEFQGNLRFATYVVCTRRGTVMSALGSNAYQRPAYTWDSVVFSTGAAGTELRQNNNNIVFNTATGNVFDNYAPNQAPSANNLFRIGHSVGVEYKYTSLDGNISCVVILNRRLTALEQTQLTTYLNKTR